ncbi:MAG: hypothetical protein KDA55_10830, partial [Planctomycetales bacterium]|nr:hypothetical protein [Planctomycetales bacterium]
PLSFDALPDGLRRAAPIPFASLRLCAFAFPSSSQRVDSVTGRLAPSRLHDFRCWTGRGVALFCLPITMRRFVVLGIWFDGR